ncbi:ATP-binding protein, partial [Coprococcus comes]|uniref:ATP-binding protein n=1 Tax=Coprococcus comes TaxID=410072 RepID=UPI0020793979
NLPAEATRTWVTKTIAETDSDGTTHYITKLADTYKVSGDSFYMQDGKAVLPLGTLTVEETKAPNGYLLEGAYMQAGDKSEQIKGLYVTQITEDGDLAVLSGSNQFSVSDNGQCLLQDLYGRVGVVQIHPVFEELLHAFDTRPPVQRNEVE